jgi:hypothetical protein
MAREQRKTVTVLFCDLAGSTDARGALEQAFERCERKENRVSGERIRTRLGELEPG